MSFVLLFTIVFLFFLVKNYRKTFLAIIVFAPFISQFKSPVVGMNLMTLWSVLSFVVVSFRIKWNFLKIKNFPVKLAFVLLAASLFLANYFSTSKHWIPTITTIIVSVVNVFFFWYLFSEKKDSMLFVIKCCFLFGFCVSVYSLFETVTRSNFYIEMVNSLDLYINRTYISEIRYGLKRSQSLFSMHTTNGAVAFILFFVLQYSEKMRELLRHKKLFDLTKRLLFCTVFFSGARSAIVGFLIALLSLCSIKKLKSRNGLVVIVMLGIVCVGISDYIESVFYSIQNTSSISGSNSDMRGLQFGVAEYYLRKNFLFGNGVAYTWNEASRLFHKELLGAESLWIPIAIDQGVFGIFSYVVLLLSTIFYSLKNHEKKLVYFIGGFWIFNTMSSLPGVNITYLFVWVFVIVETKKIYKRSEDVLVNNNSCI